MRERKYVKFKVSMYDDTKFKIIDMKRERDLIHYVWTRVVVLAGKVNLEGELYLSKNIPYTIETLAIEFNRDVDGVKAAFDVLMELEMVELTEDKVYKVINFAKHQNIKVKEKNKLSNIEETIKNRVNDEKEGYNPKVQEKIVKQQDNICRGEEEKINKNESNCLKEDVIENEQSNKVKDLTDVTVNKNISIVNDNMIYKGGKENITDNKMSSGAKSSLPLILDAKESNVKKKKDALFEMSEENDDEDICGFTDGEYKLAPGESIITTLSFS